jgi:ABC-type lipoprotein release transport system permease subunit
VSEIRYAFRALIVVHSTSPVAIGSLAGLAVAAAIGLLFAAGIPEINPRDPVGYAGVLVLIAASALCASVIPARRAASINPVDALRAD